MARAMPRRWWVGATVTELTAHAGTIAPPGTVSSATHDANVPTGVSGSGAVVSNTPISRR
ncbi:hypothetical protein GCM10025738_08100 [Microbacterium fluvii]